MYIIFIRKEIVNLRMTNIPKEDISSLKEELQKLKKKNARRKLVYVKHCIEYLFKYNKYDFLSGEDGSIMDYLEDYNIDHDAIILKAHKLHYKNICTHSINLKYPNYITDDYYTSKYIECGCGKNEDDCKRGSDDCFKRYSEGISIEDISYYDSEFSLSSTKCICMNIRLN